MSLVAVLCACLIAPAAAADAALLATVEVTPGLTDSVIEPRPNSNVIEAREVRTVWTGELGLAHPTGIAFVSDANEFLVAGETPAGDGILLGTDEDLRGIVELGPDADAPTLAYDPTRDVVTSVDDGVKLEWSADALGPSTSHGRKTRIEALAAPDFGSSSYDGDSGDLLLLSGSESEISRFDGSSVSEIPIDQIAEPMLIASNPIDGLIYVMDSGNDVYAVDATGSVQQVYDLSGVELVSPTAMVFAPTSDATDRSTDQNLFIADSGDSETLGGVVEVSLVTAAAVSVPVDTASLIRATATSGWSPGAPDPSGVAFLSDADRLIVVDSEVDETTGAGWHNVNMWRTYRTGAVQSTGTFWGPSAGVYGGSPGFSREPTGAGYDPASQTLFVSDDNERSIFVIKKGGDGQFGSSDDIVTSIDTGAYGSTDTEDPEFDPLTGYLYFLDGVGREIYQIDPVDGVFGNGNDSMTHFDISHLGPTDFEGLASNPVRGTLYVGARSTDQIFEITKTGTALREIYVGNISGLRLVSGLAVAPSSDNPAETSFYIVDRQVDNGANSNENDGRMWEVRAPDSLGTPPDPGAPSAADDASTTDEDTSVTVDVLANDTDPDGDPLTVTNLTQPVNGTTVLNANQTVTYTPDPDFNGTDTFTYTANDGTNDSNFAAVTITVNPVDDPPTAAGDAVTTITNTAATINVLANDNDPDGDPLTVTNLTQPTNGTAVVNPDDTITYTPNTDFNGTDTFTYTANDGTTNSNVATVTMTVTDAPPDPAILGSPVQTSALNAGSLSTTHVLGSAPGRRVFLLIGMDDTGLNSPQVTSATYGGVPATRVTDGTTPAYSANPTSNTTAAEIWEVPESSLPSAGTYQASVQFNTTMDAAFLIVVATEQVDQSSTVDRVVATIDGGSSYSSFITTAQPNSIVLDSLTGSTDVSPHTPGPGQVELGEHDFVDVAGHVAQYEMANSPGTVEISGQLGRSQARIAHVMIAVGPQAESSSNNPPSASDDAATTDEDSPSNVAVLANDTDPDNDPLTVTNLTQPANGTTVVNPDNTIAYTPDPDFNGTDTFTYTVNDGQANSNVATVTITVNPINDPPVAADDAGSTSEDSPVNVTVLANDSDVDGDPLTVTNLTQPANGTTVVNPDNTIEYTPAANYFGTDTFTYTANDGTTDSNSATVTVTVTPVNDPPVAADDEASTNEDVSLTIDVRANDSDVEGDPLTVTNLTQPANGTTVVNPNKTISYTPGPDFNGTDTFTYTANDGQANSNIATVTITVTPVNDPPVAADDTTSTSAATPVAVDVLANDSDVDNDPLTVANLTQPANGTTVVNPDNTITYTPAANYFGTDTFTYTANDGITDSNVATVTVTVNATPNNPPSAADDAATTDEDTPSNVAVLANDTDPDNDPLTVTNLTQPANGTTVVNPDNTVVYTPDPDYFGTDTFTYTANDGQADSNIATVTITVNPINDPPVAADDTSTTVTNTPTTIDVLANDSDIENDPLTVANLTQPSNGTTSLNPDNTVAYTPDTDFTGTDTFTYTANDGQADSNVATVTVTVDPAPNNPPSALDDVGSINEDSTGLTVDVLANDSDADGDPLTVANLTQPANGTTSLNPSGAVTYIPDPDYFGTDTFTYTANDGQADSNIATVTITVNPINDPPVAADDTSTTVTNTPTTIDVLANDSDIENDPLTVTNLTQPSNGTTSLNPDNTVAYTPDTDFTGTDTFTYTANDGQADSNVATVTVTVTEQPPVVQLALAESTLTGSIVSGGYTDTQTQNGVFEVLGESHTGGRPNIRVSELDHRWTFDIERGEAVNLELVANRSSNTEGDDFIFEYSTDGGTTFTPLLTVSSATTTSLSAALPTTISGELIVRVIDADRTPGNGSTDSVSIDYLAVVTQNSLPPLPEVGVAATDADAGEPNNPGEFTITRSSASGPLDVSYTVSGTASETTDYATLPGSISFVDGQSQATVTVVPVDDTEPEGTETVILTLEPSLTYTLASSSSDAVLISDNDQPTLEAYASSETHTYGTALGTYVDTHFDDGVYESITEERAAGGNRSRLEHQWTFNVSSGTTIEFHLQAYRSGSEAFDFLYSQDGQTWTPMVQVVATTDGTDLTYTLPTGVSGAISVRVTDSNRNKGDSSLDTITIDRMFFQVYP